MKGKHSPGTPRKRFWQGRGFYIVLALCLVAVGGLGIVTLVESISLLTDDPPAATTTTARQVGQTVPTLPDTRTTASRPVTTVPSRTTVTTAQPTRPASAPADLFILPLSNEVLAVYSDTPVYSATMDSWRVHHGTDFAGSLGQEIKALADGTVQSVYTDLLWGDCLVIDHGGGVTSLYCGIRPTAAVGDSVAVGQVIGTLTEIPCESLLPPHLHLEITSGGQPIDPIKALGREVQYITG